MAIKQEFEKAFMADLEEINVTPKRIKAVRAWTYTPAETECGEVIASADIIDPKGKSIFTEELGDYFGIFGISTKTAEKMVALLNRPVPPKKRKRK